MPKFIRTISIFLIPLLLINFVFYLIIKQSYQKPYVSHPSLNNFRTFMFADSHGEPLQKFMESEGIYNFAMASDSYTDMLRKLQFLINNYRVDRVILTADDHALSRYREGANNNDRSINLISYDQLKEIEPAMDWLSYVKEKYITQYVTLLNPKSKGFLLAHFEGILKSKKTSILFGGDWSKRPNRDKISKKRANVQFKDSYQSEDLRYSLLEIIKVCRENDIELVGLKFPLAKDYLMAVGDRSSKADSILESHDIRILDFKNAFIQEDSLFSNQDHVNSLGGKILSQRIIEDL